MLFVFAGRRDFVANTHRSDWPASIRLGLDRIKRVPGLSCADLGSINRVIAKLFLGELMLCVTDLTP